MVDCLVGYWQARLVFDQLFHELQCALYQSGEQPNYVGSPSIVYHSICLDNSLSFGVRACVRDPTPRFQKYLVDFYPPNPSYPTGCLSYVKYKVWC